METKETIKYLSLATKYDALRASHALLREYASHKEYCETLWTADLLKYNNSKGECTCGLEQALSEAEKI